MPPRGSLSSHRFELRDTPNRRLPGAYQEQWPRSIGFLENEVHRLNHQLRNADYEWNLERQENRSLRRQNVELHHTLEQSRKSESQAMNKAQTNHVAWENQKSEAKNWKHQCQKLHTESKAMEKKLDECTVQLRNIQLSTFQQAQKTWDVEEDKQIRELITNFYKSIRSWATAYTVESLSFLMKHDHGALESLFQAIGPITAISTLDSLSNFKHPFLITAALLSAHIFDHIFGNPFFALEAARQCGSGSGGGIALNKVFRKLTHDHNPEAQKFRAQLLRLLFPRPQNSLPGEILETRGVSTNDLAAFYEIIGEYFTSGPAEILLHPTIGENEFEWNKCSTELCDIIVEAGNLYARVQTQSTAFVWDPTETLLRHHFSIDSPVMRPDRFHRLEDEEDRTHDGKKVSIVLNPTVRVYGDHDGENFQKSRVVAKAVVYLEDSQPGETQQSPTIPGAYPLDIKDEEGDIKMQIKQEQTP